MGSVYTASSACHWFFPYHYHRGCPINASDFHYEAIVMDRCPFYCGFRYNCYRACCCRYRYSIYGIRANSNYGADSDWRAWIYDICGLDRHDIRKKIGLKERMLVQEALNQPTIGGVIGLVKVLFLFSISIELIAALILSIRLVPQYGWSSGLFASLFHAISAFNNAGFSLWPDNLMSYVGDPTVNLVITFLFITGGIGFTVLFDVMKNRRFKAFSLHTKLMLTGTLMLNAIAMLTVFILEYSNPDTLGHLHIVDKLWASYFQAVTPRTAGFNSLDFGSMREGTIVFTLLLMFIGAGSASTASGIKLTTFIVILTSVIAYLRGKKETVIFRRSIKYPIIIKALAVSVTSLFIVFLGIFALTITEQASFLQIVFETFSAFGTVGLTMGLTPELTTAGKCIIIVIMFIGRIGPLTFVFSFAKTEQSNIRYPDGEVFTG